MLRNYIKIAWRNIRKHPFNSFINVFGLTTGIVFTFLIGVYVWNELHVNKNLRNVSNQYFLESKWKDPNLGVSITTLGPLAKQLHATYPHLVAGYYRWDGISSGVLRGDKHFRESIQLGDSSLLTMFGFKLLHGNAARALNEPFSVVITKDIAIKYFGRTDITGETLSIQNFAGAAHDFLVTGVLEELQENSVTHLNYNNHNTIFIPANTYQFFGRMDFDNWENIYIPSYVELKEGVSPADLKEPIRQLLGRHTDDRIAKNIEVVPVRLTQYYLEKDNRLVKKMLCTLSVVGAFILFMAIINFVNISISSSSVRIREIGIRKVMGSMRNQIIFQFLAESVIIVFISTVFALVLYPLIEPVFAQVVGKSIPAINSFPLYYLVALALFILIAGILAGAYPAFVLSALKSVESLKGQLPAIKDNGIMRKSLIGLQFSISGIVMIAAFIVTKQVNYFFGSSLGYNKDLVVASQVPRDWTPAGVDKMETIRNEFSRIPQVSAATLSYEIPDGMNGFQPTVYKYGIDSRDAVAMQSMVTDPFYLNTYEVPLKAGNYFSENETDSTKVVLNETAARSLGWLNATEAIGKQLRIPNVSTVFTVKGVTNDFHFSSMHQRIAPFIIFQVNMQNVYRYLSFRLKPGNMQEALDAINRKWSTLLPGSSFEYNFIDDKLQQLYAPEIQLKKAAYTATFLALVIVLLGILGLLSLSIQKRTKEIAIRKVLGASVGNIIQLFQKEFLLVLIISIAVSLPVAWMLMQEWLNNYSYRMKLTFEPFLLSIIILGFFTMLIVSLQILIAVRSGLAGKLKSE